MAKGTKASVSYFNGAETGKVGKAQKGGKSAGGGGKLGVIDGGSTASAAASAPKGVPAGGTENIAADQRSIRAAQPGSTTSGKADKTPAAVAKHSGLSAKPASK